MKEEKKYRVFNHGIHEYNIQTSENKDGHRTYNLITQGTSWIEDAVDKTVCQMINDGNGYHITGINEYMDYAEMLQLQILFQFVSWYESQDHGSVITIESCKEKLRFSI